MDEAQIEKVIELAFKVKNGAGVFLKKAIGEIARVESDTAESCCDHNCTC